MTPASLMGISEIFSITIVVKVIIMVSYVLCRSVASQISTRIGDVIGDVVISTSADLDWAKMTRDDVVRTTNPLTAQDSRLGNMLPLSVAVQRDDHVRKRRSPFDAFRKIYPGTKWCGAGNIAEHKDDRGRFDDTDSCCYQHDHCQLTLAGGEMRYGVRNPKSYTVSSCECDERFRACLQEVASFVSLQVGNFFFNIIQVPCLEMRPSEGTGRLVSCQAYSQQTKKPTIRQVFSGEATFWGWLGGVFSGK